MEGPVQPGVAHSAERIVFDCEGFDGILWARDRADLPELTRETMLRGEVTWNYVVRLF